ncbi:MAG: DUF1028 domain-containing protein [Rhodobacteraceae bacterium]|nr:DUF1028 domain-containing protein [Paracoccaceae bacterium]
MTFSISGRCAETGMLGIAITTSSICVGSRCPWVRANVGAVSTQNVTLPSIGTAVLDRIEVGQDAESSLKAVMDSEPHREFRQVTAIDRNGATASFSGRETLGTHNISHGSNCVAAGNLLADENLPHVMTGTFASAEGTHLAERLLRSLEAGLNKGGGERGPVHSAALLVTESFGWPIVDLRVDWADDCPLQQLRRLWNDYQPQMQDYLTRALNPNAAPSYGVPGDE